MKKRKWERKSVSHVDDHGFKILQKDEKAIDLTNLFFFFNWSWQVSGLEWIMVNA